MSGSVELLGRDPDELRELIQDATPYELAAVLHSLKLERGYDYEVDPVAFVHDAFVWEDERPAGYQDRVLDALARHKRIAVRGPHGLGKTTVAAWAVLWFALTREHAGKDWKVPTTASAWRQLILYLWPEVHKWVRRLRWDVVGRHEFDERRELLALSLSLRHGKAFALASDDPAKIEGAHEDALLYVFDEAKTIPAGTFDAAEGAFAGAGDDTHREAFALAFSTPGSPSGRFYEIHKRAPGFEDWYVEHVTLDEAISAGRVSQEWATARQRQWGTASAVYKNRVLGEFASSEEDAVIPLEWVELTVERWRALELRGDLDIPVDPYRVGVDVARSGEDKTVLAIRRGWTITRLERYVHSLTTETTGHVARLFASQVDPCQLAVIDVLNMGAGVVDQLREQQLSVCAFNAGARTDRTDHSGELRFMNCRAALWWNLRELLDPERGEPVALPPDDELLGELTAPKLRTHSTGKIQIESKDDIRRRIGRSTDAADAVAQALWEPLTYEVGSNYDELAGWSLAR